MSEATPSPTRRILLAIDTSPFSLLAVEIAAQLAAELHSELEGLFYEDVDLLKLSGLPFAREVGFTSATGRPLNAVSMEQLLRAKADEIRRLLARTCTELKLSWSLTTIRQRAIHHALQSARDVDFLVIGIESRKPQAWVQLRRAQRTGRSVVLLYDGSPASRRALTVSLRAARQGWQLVILPVAETAEDAQRVSRDASQNLPITADVYHRPVRSTADVLEVIRSRRGELLVAPWNSTITDEASLEKLIGESDCLVMLVR